MTLATVNAICAKSCSFSTYMLALCTKLQAERRGPTEREATEIAEQERALAASIPKMGDGPPATVPQL